MGKQYRFWLLFLTVLAAEHFTAAIQAAEKNLLKVRAGYVTPTTDNVLLPIAQKQGFLAKHGIEVEIIALRGGVQVAQALLSDSLQFAQMAGSVVVRSDLSGGDLVMIAGYVSRISYFLIAKPEIKEIKALAGKKIATASIGGSVDMVLRLGLKASGVDPKSVIFLSAGPHKPEWLPSRADRWMPPSCRQRISRQSKKLVSKLSKISLSWIFISSTPD